MIVELEKSRYGDMEEGNKARSWEEQRQTLEMAKDSVDKLKD